MIDMAALIFALALGVLLVCFEIANGDDEDA